jgi:hypothetical protein
LLLFHVWPSNQTLIKGVTICHALRYNFNIQKICDIFCPHTAEYYEPTPTNCSEFYQICLFRFGSVWGGADSAGDSFPFKSSGEKCECFVRRGRRHDYLLFISYIVYRSSWAFIKIKNQN